MKKIFFLPIMALFLFSCSDKDNLNTPNVNNENEQGHFTLLSKSVIEMNDLITSADFQIGLIADANFGYLDYSEEHPSFKANGVFPKGSNLKIKINDKVLTPTREDGAMLEYNAEFAEFYGKEAKITVSEGEVNLRNSVEETIYFPALLHSEMLTPVIANTVYISRDDSNILTWEADPNNELNVLIQYEVFDRENYYEDANSQIESSYFLTEDDGSYDISELIKAENIKSIKISMVRLNAIEYNTENAEKIMIGASTSDHHFYMVQ